METLVHKSSTADKNASGNTSSNVQYTSMSNTNISSLLPAPTPAPTVLPQPVRITKPAKPVRDGAQFVCYK